MESRDFVGANITAVSGWIKMIVLFNKISPAIREMSIGLQY